MFKVATSCCLMSVFHLLLNVLFVDFRLCCECWNNFAVFLCPFKITSLPSLVRIQVKRLIKSNAVYEKRSTYRRCCWYVHAAVLTRCDQEALPVPCQWTYLTTGAREESREEPQAATGSQASSPTTPQTSLSSNKRKSSGSMSITKFMKKCSDPEQVLCVLDLILRCPDLFSPPLRT